MNPEIKRLDGAAPPNALESRQSTRGIGRREEQLLTVFFVIRRRLAFGVLGGATALALTQPASSSQQPGAPAGGIAIASQALGVLTVVGLQGQPAREFKVGCLPHEVAAAGRLVFVSNYGNAHVRSSDLVVNCADNGRVLLIEAGTLSLTHQIAVGSLPIGIAGPDDRFAYVANMRDDTISVIDIRRGAVVRTIPAGDEPDGIVFFPD